GENLKKHAAAIVPINRKQNSKIHYRKPSVFHEDRIKMYSEEDYIVKFWSFIFESFFGTDEHIFLHWGDTEAESCKKFGLKMNIDMHMMEGGNCSLNAGG
ncbi:hypothetical protein EDC94DRAFT_127701, partial [Helicostylum pulchrum]